MTLFGRAILFTVAALWAAGCGVTVRNTTPSMLVRNASGIYPIEARVNKNNSAILDKSIRTDLVIWDQTVPMTLVAPSTDTEPSHWTHSLVVPPGQSEIYYYFRIRYQLEKPLVSIENREAVFPRGAPQKTYLLRISDRMSAGLDSERGRVGSTISVLGKGFTPDDHVSIGGQLMPTTFKDSGVLKFQILPVAGNQSYPVEVVGAANDVIKSGTLIVDNSDFAVIPIALVQGAKAWLTIRIPQPAPPGGITVTLKPSDPTLVDLPASITIKEGKTEAVIKTVGGAIGAATLSVESLGFQPASVPINVVENK